MNKVFHKNFSAERKNWLLSYDPTKYNVPLCNYSVSQYFDQELIKYSMEDCKRSIPNLFDGLKVSQRKCLFSVFRKNLQYQSKSMKVAQLAGYCAEHSNYHHGENCLFETIIKMSHQFPGSNNLPYFERDGQFGSRSHGGKDAANARYIFTKLAPLTRFVFPLEDDCLLDYTLDDGDKVEPDFYVPIIPTCLLNGCTAGIGTGWSCFIPCFDFYQLLAKIRDYLEGDRQVFSLDPSYYGYKGRIEKVDNEKYKTFGSIQSFTKKNKIFYEITELPIGVWTDKYKEELETMQEQKKIRSLKNYSTTDKIHFVFEPGEGRFTEETMKLVKVLHLGNMVLFTEQHQIQKFNSLQDIFNVYFEKRFELYQKRISSTITKLEHEISLLENKSKFLKKVIDQDIQLYRIIDDNLTNVLQEHGFPTYNDSYEYLLSIPIRNMTFTKYKLLLSKIDETSQQLEVYLRMEPKTLWLKDLQQLEKEYKKYYQEI